MRAGEQLIVHTAGAGGWGSPEHAADSEADQGKMQMAGSLTRANGSIGMYSTAQNECD